jgi:hypothetical protein
LLLEKLKGLSDRQADMVLFYLFGSYESALENEKTKKEAKLFFERLTSAIKNVTEMNIK